MRTWSAVLLGMAGFSLWGCSDGGGGPGIGPDTSWQVACSEDNSGGCGTSQDPHGPIGGTQKDSDRDDQDISVSCSKTSAGYQITLEDPGRTMADPEDSTIRPRARSVLKITNAIVDTKKCFVEVDEYNRGGTMYKLTESCTGTKNTPNEGNCTLTGKAGNGYDFDGTLECPGMRVNGQGPPDYKLAAARNLDSPMKLQIEHCK